jgi:SAM-dependent methyltransferase
MFDQIWEKIHSERVWGIYPKEEVIRWVAHNFYHTEDRSKVKFLDLGCGAGANTWFLDREGFDVTGIDGSPSAISRSLVKGKCFVADATNLPFEDNSFDAVIDVACIAHNKLQDAKGIIKEVRRVLKQEGVLLSIMPSSDCYRGPYEGKGTTIFLNEIEINSLFYPEINVLTDWTAYGWGNYTIKHWIISGTKVGA